MRFRWKLAVTTALATVVPTVLVVTALSLLTSLQVRRARLDSGTPRAVQAQLRAWSEDLTPMLAVEPVDAAAIGSWIDSREAPGSLLVSLKGYVDDALTEGKVTVEMMRLAIADENGRVVGRFPRDAFEAGAVLPEIVGNRTVIEEALKPNPDPEGLMARTAVGDTVAVAPIRDAEGRIHGLVYAEASTGPVSTMTLLLDVLVDLPGFILRLIPVAVVLGLLVSLVSGRGLVRRVQRLARAAAAWSRGDLQHRVRDGSADEIGELARGLDAMADRLNAMMETRRELAAMEERNHLARELHDTVKQQIFAISMLLGSIEANAESDPATARRNLIDARELVRQAGQDLNALILQLRPAALEGQGLAVALQRHCANWSRRTGVECRFGVEGDRELPLEIEQELYRVAQEALSNVARHSRASTARVHLGIAGATSGPVTLEVHDDGRGFDGKATQHGGQGLRSMRERLDRIGGCIDVSTPAGGGTLVRALCPMSATEEHR